MFSGASSFAERLRAAAQAGVEQFDQARVHAPDLHLPKINLTGPSSPGQGTSTPVQSPLSPGAENVKRLVGITSPRRSGEIERTSSAGSGHSALSSRLNSLVAGATKGRAQVKPATSNLTQTTGLSTPASISDASGSMVPQPQAANVNSELVDPASIPLPPSPEVVPFILTETNTPDLSLAGTGTATPTIATGLSLFNTPRNPLPTSPSSALGIHRTKTPSPLSSPVVAPTTVAAGQEDDIPAVIEEEVAVAKEPAPPAVSSEMSGESAAQKADIPDSTVKVEAVSEVQPSNAEYDALKVKADKANAILRKASPLLTDGISDTDALESWVKMVSGKVEMGDSEMKRLSDKLALQESRIKELRETHRLESESSNKLVTTLREQLAKAESNLSSQASQLLQMTQLQTELKTAQNRIREEEDKRGKAVTLLKTVRTKLVKVEREKEEVDKRQEEEKAERQKLFDNLERLRNEREREIQSLKQSHERDNAALKDKYEKNMLAKRREWELEMITTKVSWKRLASFSRSSLSNKASHAKDIAAKSKHINSLVESMQELNNEKRSQYETLQARQEELETAIAAKEMHESRTRELQLQAQEALERAQIAEDALEELQREHVAPATNGITNLNPADAIGSSEISQLLADAAVKSDAKLTELREEIARLERESSEHEEQQARQLRLRSQEIERLRTTLNEKQAEFAQAINGKESSDAKISEMERELEVANRERESLKEALRVAQTAQMQFGNGDEELRAEISLLKSQIEGLNSQLEEARQIHAQLRSTNRTLREEMRRIQSSAQLLERQRNPGVGYWSSSNAGSTPANGTPGGVTSPGVASSPTGSVRGSVDVSRSGPSTPVGKTGTPAGSQSVQGEEEVNLEYLRNVILQFLEHKEMRPNLVRVLTVILRFTPQETRRLNAKLTA
ncbi:hypothetical protein NliqN6_6127 [Naganishia liquefaciens]|uniref:GRIP domain-containing protein n=1 Tax=Naganishia liquefaciens TaxID=104408 RepID=A0A8H3YH95_9TREE|nr:hypothetical protein NliqN6_6127 [Naganishia liquefaciens]